MNSPRILIACIGNIFLGDDAFGVEVARRLAGRSMPEDVKVVDYGIRGLDLAYAILDGHDVTVFVDATPRGGEPGTLYLIEPNLQFLEDVGDVSMVEGHGMNPMNVLRLVRSMGGEPGRILLVGCEPEALNPEGEGAMGLSDRVQAAVDEAVTMIESLVARIRKESHASSAA